MAGRRRTLWESAAWLACAIRAGALGVRAIEVRVQLQPSRVRAASPVYNMCGTRDTDAHDAARGAGAAARATRFTLVSPFLAYACRCTWAPTVSSSLSESPPNTEGGLGPPVEARPPPGLRTCKPYVFPLIPITGRGCFFISMVAAVVGCSSGLF